jgi:hypothetical protein
VPTNPSSLSCTALETRACLTKSDTLDSTIVVAATPRPSSRPSSSPPDVLGGSGTRKRNRARRSMTSPMEVMTAL